MSFPDGASRIGFPAEWLSGWRLPVSRAVGAAGLALALVLGAGPLAAAAAAAAGAERAPAKVAPPPDTSGLHPVEQTRWRPGAGPSRSGPGPGCSSRRDFP